MPPRKSTSATPADSDETQDQPQTQSTSTPVTATEQQLKARAEAGVNVEDYLLPRSLTLRLAKSVLPPNTAVQKDAVLAIQKAATVFVSYLSSHANEATLKRTVAPADVFSALSELEFDSFRDRLQKELDAHTEQKAGKRRAKKGPEDTVGKPAEGAEANTNTAHGAKRVKRVSGEGSGEALNRENGEEDGDGDETQDEPDMMNDEDEDNEEDVEEEEDDEGEGEGEEGGEEDEEEEDINRVEDLDRDSRSKRTMDPDAVSDHSDSEEESGPSAQLRNDVGFG